MCFVNFSKSSFTWSGSYTCRNLICMSQEGGWAPWYSQAHLLTMLGDFPLWLQRESASATHRSLNSHERNPLGFLSHCWHSRNSLFRRVERCGLGTLRLSSSTLSLSLYGCGRQSAVTHGPCPPSWNRWICHLTGHRDFAEGIKFRRVR